MGFKKLHTISSESSAIMLKLSYGRSMHNSLICAVPESRVENYRTVSGGALIADNMLVGVSSWAPAIFNAAKKPELFASFTFSSKWINNVTNIELY